MTITTNFLVEVCFFPLETNLGYFFYREHFFGVFFQPVGGPSGSVTQGCI